MRIAYFHNWSWLGWSLARALLASRDNEIWIVGGNAPRAARIPGLVEAARRQRVLCVSPTDVGSPPFIARLRRFAPQLIVVGTFAKKLTPALLAIPQIAAINIHCSLLPRYRGALPEFWVIRNGETESGVTIHHMTERFDAGAILAQSRFPLTPEDTLLSVSVKMSDAARPLLDGLLQRYRCGERPAGVTQEESRATLAPMVCEAELEVHWTEPAAAIERLVRAAYPVFEVHTRFRNERIGIRSVQLVCARENLGPGELRLDRDARRLLAGTGAGVLALESVKPSGGSSLTGIQFAQSRALAHAEVLGR